MNDRINELIKQSYVEVPHERDWDAMSRVFDKQKFAELIIKECIKIPYQMWDKAELNADIAVKIENRINDHFGCEFNDE